MVKRLALVLVALSWVFPFSVNALGLGNIDMRSTLNQRLDARIGLLRVRQGELKGIEISLASEETFQRAGIERPKFLNNVSFSLVRPDSGGKPYIQLSSPQPITEPFLNFLVEVNWANGRLLREFTVLVDPPVLADERRSRAVDAPAVTRAAPAPRQRQRQVTTQTRKTTRSVPRGTEFAPEVITTASGGVEYGPTKNGDTLWEIAARMRPEGSSISVPQMMIAILESNPGAFYGGNINNLKMGHVLRLADSGESVAVSHSEAARMASVQWEQWKDNRGMSMMGSSPSSTRSASTGRPKLGARVKLVSPDEGEAGDGTPRSVEDGGQVARLSEELSLAQEALDATRQETSELNTNMSALAEQIETMKRLVSLKDSQLAALQSQLAEAGQKPEMPVADEVVMAEMAGATAKEMTEAAPAVEEPAVVDETGEISNDQSEMDAILSGDGSESQPMKEKVDQKPVPMEAEAVAATDEGIMGMLSSLPSKIMGDMKYTAIAGGILIFIIIMAVMLVKRRKMQSFQESILTGQSTLDDGVESETTEDASFMSDFAVSSMEGIATVASEVDPVSEADVYLAYGRYKQAEELITDAIASHPEKSELKLKVLEIHYAAKDKDAFESNADMYKGALGEHWAKVCEMGVELCPDNDLFTGDAPAASSSSATVAMAAVDMDAIDAIDNEMDFDLGSTDDSAGSGSLDDDVSSDIDNLDFDLGMDDDSPAADEPVAAAEPESDDNSLDFDLGDFETEESLESSDDTPTNATEMVDVVSEMSLDAAESSVEETAASDDNSLDFDLGSMDMGDSSAEDEITAEAEPEAELEMSDDNSLDFDLGGLDEAPTSEDEEETSSMEITDADMETELDESLFADVDEVGTKLDLARAYIDMGDSDGAKSILDEVMEEGDDTQKNEAEDLIQQMA